ncbi:hypothetical protein [Pseudanabaena sp. PCC 6802]|nr:hypothetical protein [Pseudanabaena sp. PCC 6802]
MPVDNLCKYLAEQSPRQFVQWLIPSAGALLDFTAPEDLSSWLEQN